MSEKLIDSRLTRHAYVLTDMRYGTAYIAQVLDGEPEGTPLYVIDCVDQDITDRGKGYLLYDVDTQSVCDTSVDFDTYDAQSLAQSLVVEGALEPITVQDVIKIRRVLIGARLRSPDHDPRNERLGL